MPGGQTGGGSCDKLCYHPFSYPFSLPRTSLTKRALSIYQSTLRGNAKSPYGTLDLFDDENHEIETWDFWDNDSKWKLQKLSGLRQVELSMHKDKKEPTCRFIYLYTANSRDPLCCSREQLEHTLNHYQVMAPFLEHIFTFNRRQDPHVQASFRSEDNIWGRRAAPRLESSRIQHCFNLVGVEYDDESTSDRFKYRQTAAYFSLDLISGRTVWLIIKGNEVIRESLQELTADLDQPNHITDVNEAFVFALRSHLVISMWSIQSWTPYINSIHKRYADIAKAVAYTPVMSKTQDDIIDQAVFKSTTWANGRQNSGVQRSQGKVQSWGKMILRMNSSKVQSKPTIAHTRKPANSSPVVRPDITKIFTFDKLQILHRAATDVQTGLSVLDQNKTVLQDMLKHFQYLQESEDFLQSVKVDKEDFQTFTYKTEHCIGELEHQHHRLSSVQLELERAISLFHGILEHHNMRTGESYARAAKISTDKMEEITVQTKQETVSIHVITILTLIFLPATFVATFFGSGVIDFEKGETQGRWGFWEVRWGALMLFGAVFGPLTGAVLAAWAFTYLKTRERQKNEDTNQGAVV